MGMQIEYLIPFEYIHLYLSNLASSITKACLKIFQIPCLAMKQVLQIHIGVTFDIQTGQN